MKKIIISLCCFFLVGIGESFAQNSALIYDAASEEVKTKMNSNKVLGVNVLEGVDAAHVFKVDGLTEANSQQINSILEGSTLIFSVDFALENGLIGIVSNASLYRQDLEQLLANVGITIVNYSVTYSLRG